MLRAAARAAILVFALICGAPAYAQYPNRPVTIIVSLAAGRAGVRTVNVRTTGLLAENGTI